MSQKGNVVTEEIVAELILSGTDTIKVEIDPGKLVSLGLLSLSHGNILGTLKSHSCHGLPRLCEYTQKKTEFEVSVSHCSYGLHKCYL